MGRRKLNWKIIGLIGVVLVALVAALVVTNQDQFGGLFGAGGKGKKPPKETGGGGGEGGGGRPEDKGPPPGQAEGPPPAGPAETKGQPGAAWTRKGLEDTQQDQNIYAAGETLSYHTANMPPGDYTIIVHRPGKHGEVMVTQDVTVGADGSLNWEIGTIPDDWSGVFQVQIWGADGHMKNDNINVKAGKKPPPPCENPPCDDECEDPPCGCEDPPCGCPPGECPEPPPGPPVEPAPVAKPECELCANSVIFHSNRTGAWQLYRLDAEEGGRPVNLTVNSASNLAPSRSVDNRWVAYQSDRDGNWEIYVMDINGDRQTRVTYNSVADDIDPVWAPQCLETTCASGLIAFQSDRDLNWEIYVVDVLTGEERRLTYNTGSDENPYWSPDAQWVAFQSNRDGNWEIYVISQDGKTLWRVTNHEADDLAPVWSPTGQQIALLSNRDGKWGVYVVDANAENLRMLTDATGDETNVSWSPDGTALAFQSNRDGNWEIYKVVVATGELTRLTNDPAADQHPSWSCDGSVIIFTSDRDGNPELYGMSAVDGSGVQRLTGDVADDICPLSMPVEENACR
ncbi:MAG: TolB family protein [Anaerolineae bacterium]